MATWAQSLFTGENYNGIVDLRATTVKGYLEAAQHLLITAGYKHDEGLRLDKNNS